MPLKLRFSGPNPLPAVSAAVLSIIILSFSPFLFLPCRGHAISATIYLEKGPPGGPYTTYDPSTQNLLIGEELHLFASLFNDSAKLDYMCPSPGMDPADCVNCWVDGDVNRVSQNAGFLCFPNCVFGYYCFYPDKPAVLGSLLYPSNINGSLSAISADPLLFSKGTPATYTQWVEWVWMAEAVDNFNLNLCAITNADWINGGSVWFTAVEGTTLSFDRCGITTKTTPATTDILPANINIVSPLSGVTTVTVISPGTRPAGCAFIGDEIRVVTGITNSGAAPANIVSGGYGACAVANESIGDTLYPFPADGAGGCSNPKSECGSPVLPVVIPGSGGTASFTWTFSVSGAEGTPGYPGSGSLFVETSIKGTPSVSASISVTPAPMDMVVNLFVDPDGVAGPLAAVPLGIDPDDSTKNAYLYYMAAETLEIRVTVTNQSAYTYDVAPALYVNGRSSLPTYRPVGPPPVLPYTMPAGAGNTKTFTWVYEPDPAYMGDCLVQPDPQNLGIRVQDRGLLVDKNVTITAHPFYDPTCPGGLFSFNAPFISFTWGAFPVVVNLRNRDTRRVYMAHPLSVTLYVADDWHAVDPKDMPVPYLPATWNGGETKSFTWTFTSTGITCSVMIESALLWPDTSAYRCFNGSSEQPPKCSTNTARVDIVPKPDVYIDHFYFTTPSPVVAFEQPVELEMCLVNSSTIQTVGITEFCDKPDPVPAGVQGLEADNLAGHGTVIGFNWPSIPPVTMALPVNIAPGASVYFHWSMFLNDCTGPVMSDPEVSFGCFNSGWGNNLVKGNPALSLKGVTGNTIRSTIPVTLECETFTPRPEYSVGQIIQVYQKVKNAGQNDAEGFSATLIVESVPPGTVKFLSMTPAQDSTIFGVGDCRPSPWDGMEATYRYDYEAMTKGYVRFTSTFTATDSISGYPKKEVPIPPATVCQTPWLRIADPGIMEMTVAATPLVTLSRSCPSCPAVSECPTKNENCIKVDMSLKNRGEISLIEVLPSFVSIAPCPPDNPALCPGCLTNLCPGSRTYTGDVSVVPEPVMVPSFPPTGDLLAEGDIHYYSWTFTPTALGCVRIYMQANAKDAATGKVWNPLDYTNCINIVERRPVEISLLNPQATVTSGQEFEVSIEIFNPGFTDVIMRGGEPALIFIDPETGAAVTERFDVRIPTPVTVVSGAHVVIKAKVRVLPGAPIGAVEIRIPQSSMYAATDAVTGASVSVVNTGQAKIIEIMAPHWGLGPFVPNPFRPRIGVPVAIQYTVGEPAKVKIKVYTLSGELVKTLWDGQRETGLWTVEWDGRNSGARVVASGIYLIHLESPGFNEVKKLALVK